MFLFKKLGNLKYIPLGFLTTYWLTSYPAFGATNTISTDFIIFYRNEFTFMLCVVVLGLGTWLGMKLPTGVGERDLPNSVKFVSALLGGILAFTYCVHRDKGLTLINPLWIVTASIALPLTILTLQDKILTYVRGIKLPKSGE